MNRDPRTTQLPHRETNRVADSHRVVAVAMAAAGAVARRVVGVHKVAAAGVAEVHVLTIVSRTVAKKVAKSAVA